MNLKNILLSCVSCLVLSGCYTQLAMFYPEPEIEQEEEQFYETYSRAVPRLGVNAYAQDGAGTPLSLAYTTMYNRFNNLYGSGYYNKYDYYNRYGYHAGFYGYDSYQLAGYTMYIPTTDFYASGERKPRTFSTSRDGTSSGTNLNITRSNHVGYNSKNNNSYGNSSNVSSTRSSSGGSSSSSSSSSGRRATRRN